MSGSPRERAAVAATAPHHQYPQQRSCCLASAPLLPDSTARARRLPAASAAQDECNSSVGVWEGFEGPLCSSITLYLLAGVRALSVL